MSKPTLEDPLGQRPDPADFGDVMNGLIDERIKMHMRGRTDAQFDGVADTLLVHELIARGWAVFYPAANRQ